MVFFEAPHRLQSFLHDCHDILGERQVFWCRELTKMHEEITRGTLSTILDHCRDKKIKGESVFIIAGVEAESEIPENRIAELLSAYRKSGKTSLKDAVRKVTSEHKVSRSAVYRQALKIWK